ncbi:MAG: YfhO family protein [Chloroflexi bacterium]|nr:YfhO family protein [Chloroflexota bacterium]MCL5075565.1 YfhO family protein [Chloroflexota bacterium]
MSTFVLVTIVLILVAAFHQLYHQRRIAEPYHRDLLAVCFLVLLVVGFFWRPIFKQGVWIPAGGGDLASMIYPNYRLASESFKQGVFPLWNPYLACGSPFVGDIQAGIFYPVNLAVMLLAPELTYSLVEMLVYLHFFLSGLFTYIMMRHLFSGPSQVGRLASLTAAVAFMFSDVFIVHIGNLNLIAVAAWLPLVFLLIYRAFADQRFDLAIVGGLITGIAFLAGHIQSFLYIIFAISLYALFHFYTSISARKPVKEAMTIAVIFTVFAVTSLGASAVLLLPSYELSRQAVRSEVSYAASTAYSLPPSQLISLIVPGFFGRGPSAYWGQWLRTETGYIGILPLLAAALALSLRRERIIYFLGGLAALTLLLAMGGATALHGWIYQLLPGFNIIRAPARFVLLFDFAIAALAGLGIDTLLRPMRRRERTILATFSRLLLIVLGAAMFLASILLVILGLYRDNIALPRVTGMVEGWVLFTILLAASLTLLLMRRYRRARTAILGTAALAIVALDLISNGFNLEISTTDPTRGFQHPEIIQFLKSDHSFYRVDSDTGIWGDWQPNTTTLNGIFDVMGGIHPLELADFRSYWNALGSRSTPLYDLFNVKYIIGHKNVPLDWDKFALVFAGDPNLNVYVNKKVMPRAFVVHKALIQPDHAAVLRQIQPPGFDPSRAVLLESGMPISLAPTKPSFAHITRYSQNEITVRVEATARGYLVLSEVYYDGWRAYVDGEARPVLRADYLFRAIAVDEGEHEVRLVFEPSSFSMGLLITKLTWTLALAALAGLFIWRRFRRYLA